jgi:stage II sporulation protein D
MMLLFPGSGTLAQQTVRIGLYYAAASRTHATVQSMEMNNVRGLTVSLQLSQPVSMSQTYTDLQIGISKPQYVQLGAFQHVADAYSLALDAAGKMLKPYVVYRADGSPSPYKVWVDDSELAVRALYPQIGNIFFAATQGDLLAIKDKAQAVPGIISDGRIQLRIQPLGEAPTRVVAGGQVTRNYEGAFDLGVVNRNITLVNILDLEQYVLGVVPYEMSDSWPLEVLKAQAVAARSYALVNLKKHQSLGFGLCDSPECCQKYAGYNSAYSNTQRAVDETAGKFARFNGQVAQLFYHSNSGGYTENSEDVWSAAVPYVRAVPDPYSTCEPLLTHLLSRANNNTEFPARWIRSFTRQELELLVKENSGVDVGTLLEISSLSRSAGGRHLTLLVRGTNGEARIERSNTRFAFNLPSSLYDIIPIQQSVHVMGTGDSIKEINLDNHVYIATASGVKVAAPYDAQVFISNGTKVRAISKVPGGFAFNGRGWGHGVGMSQWGAFEMARQGYNYQDIIQYYFQGVTID